MLFIVFFPAKSLNKTTSLISNLAWNVIIVSSDLNDNNLEWIPNKQGCE